MLCLSLKALHCSCGGPKAPSAWGAGGVDLLCRGEAEGCWGPAQPLLPPNLIKTWSTREIGQIYPQRTSSMPPNPSLWPYLMPWALDTE